MKGKKEGTRRNSKPFPSAGTERFEDVRKLEQERVKNLLLLNRLCLQSE
jgi:hypothetical protein